MKCCEKARFNINISMIQRNGDPYVYLSNESNQYVDFDNLFINQKQGSL